MSPITAAIQYRHFGFNLVRKPISSQPLTDTDNREVRPG